MGWLLAVKELIQIMKLVSGFIKDVKDQSERKERAEKLKEALIEARKSKDTSKLESLLK